MKVEGLYTPRVRVKADLRSLPTTGNLSQNELAQLNNQQLLGVLAGNSNIDLTLKTLANAFTPRVVTVGTTATLVIQPEQYLRGYTLINPQLFASGTTSATTLFALAAAGAGIYTSPEVDVSAINEVRAFLRISAQAVGATIQVDAQSQDPLSTLWTTVSTNIFTLNSAIGVYYADLGSFGVDANFRMVVTITGGSITFSLSMLTKGGIVTSTGSTIYLGNSDVNVNFGYALLPGQKETFYLKENTPIYAIVASGSVGLQVFQLQ